MKLKANSVVTSLRSRKSKRWFADVKKNSFVSLLIEAMLITFLTLSAKLMILFYLPQTYPYPLLTWWTGGSGGPHFTGPRGSAERPYVTSSSTLARRYTSVMMR